MFGIVDKMNNNQILHNLSVKISEKTSSYQRYGFCQTYRSMLMERRNNHYYCVKNDSLKIHIA